MNHRRASSRFAAGSAALLVSGGVACTTTPAAPPAPTKNDQETAAMPPSMTAVPQTKLLSLSASTGAPPKALFVLLHGVGADAQSFHEIAKELAPGFPQADFVTPDGFQPFDQAPSGRQWFSIQGVTPENRGARVREAGTQVSAWIDAELDKRKLGHDKVVIVGFSQGAIVGSWLAVHRAPSPLAVVMFSGRVADDAAPIANKVSTPVFWGHGTKDPRIPIIDQERGVPVLEAWGAKVTPHEYAGLGHSIEAREISDVTQYLKDIVPP